MDLARLGLVCDASMMPTLHASENQQITAAGAQLIAASMMPTLHASENSLLLRERAEGDTASMMPTLHASENCWRDV